MIMIMSIVAAGRFSRVCFVDSALLVPDYTSQAGPAARPMMQHGRDARECCLLATTTDVDARGKKNTHKHT